MTEVKARDLVAQLSEAEKRELLEFIHFLIKCREEGRTVSSQEVQEMAAAARNRIASQQ